MFSARNLLSSRTPQLSRRDLLKLGAAGVVGYSQSGWMEALAQDAVVSSPRRPRSCILLWMEGGPSTIDLFDLKPGNLNGGDFREISTSVPGIRIGEHLPRVARNMHDMAIIRSMSTREGEHGRAALYLRTGYRQQQGSTVRYPSLGALVAKELPNDTTPLPNFVALFPQGPQEGWGAGFLGPRYAPLVINGNDGGGGGRNNFGLAARIPNVAPPQGRTQAQIDPRIDMLLEREREFAAQNPGLATSSHASAYDRAARLMRSEAAAAFNLEQESAQTRQRYGTNRFGQGCLLARRLVERGVSFVEVTLNGWDTHGQNFQAVRNLCGTLDPAYAALMEDLRERGLLSSTLIVWMGEFGRTPRINGQRGRDHWPNSFCAVLAGGAINGGQAYGQTSPNGTVVESAPTDVKTFLATVWRGLGVDHTRYNISNIGRPIRISDTGGIPIADIVG